MFFNSISNLKPPAVGENLVIFISKSLMLEPAAVSLVVEGFLEVVVVASVVVVVASVVVVVASVVVVVASVSVSVVAVVSDSVVVATVVSDSVSVSFSVSEVSGSSVSSVSVSFSLVCVAIVSICFLPKIAFSPDVLSRAHKTMIARKIIPRKVISPIRPGSLTALVSFLRFLGLTGVTGEIALS